MKIIHISTLTLVLLLSVININAQCLVNSHSPFENQGWLSCSTSHSIIPERGDRHWVLYDLGHTYTVDSMFFWNYNVWGETGYGVKEILIDYSENKIDWTTIGPFTIQKAPGSWKYEGAPGPVLNDILSRYLLITIIDTWDTNAPCAGFGEVKISVKSPVGTEENTFIADFSIFPNPAIDWIEIALPEGLTSNSISITNALGQKIKTMEIPTHNLLRIPIDDLSDGIYYVSIFGKSNMISKSFIKISQ